MAVDIEHVPLYRLVLWYIVYFSGSFFLLFFLRYKKKYRKYP